MNDRQHPIEPEAEIIQIPKLALWAVKLCSWTYRQIERLHTWFNTLLSLSWDSNFFFPRRSSFSFYTTSYAPLQLTVYYLFASYPGEQGIS